LTPDEVETYQSQLDGILTYIEKLNQIDVSSVEPMAQGLFQQPESTAAVDEHPELREDVLCPAEVSSAILSQAPDATPPFFRVPKVIER
jgi:aspartyl-tRNA(Asn)/glutamyl-tRNA(Gln) amidotransferase subunit C